MTAQRTRLVLLVILLGSLAAAALFATRAVSNGVHAHRDQEGIRPWMSIPYIAHSQGVPQKTLWDAIGIVPRLHDHRPIRRIARDAKRQVDDMMAQLRKAIGNEHKGTSEKPPGKSTPE